MAAAVTRLRGPHGRLPLPITALVGFILGVVAVAVISLVSYQSLQTRQTAISEGLDPDGDVVWGRIMAVTAHG